MTCTRRIEPSLGQSLVLLIVLGVGCAAQTDAETEDTSVGVVEQEVTTVDDLTCDFCQVARECCFAVSGSSSCQNFDADYCETLDPGRKRTTILNCLVQVRTTIYAWASAGREPPDECHIP